VSPATFLYDGSVYVNCVCYDGITYLGAIGSFQVNQTPALTGNAGLATVAITCVETETCSYDIGDAFIDY